MTGSAYRRHRWGRWLPFLLAVAWVTVAEASVPWPEVPFQYHARDFSLSQAFIDFARAFGLRTDIDPAIEGRLKGDYSAATPTQFLETLASSHGLTWYCYNGVLHVSPAADSIRRGLRVGAGDIGLLRDALKNLGIFDSRFGWAEFPERGLVILSGPPAYVNQVTAVLSEMGVGPRDGREIRVFQLKHARAEDRVFSYRNQAVTTPGIVSILRNLVAGQGSTAYRPPTLASTTLPPASSLPTLGGSDGRDKAAGGEPGAAAGSRPEKDAPSPVSMSANSRNPVIEADLRLNAVIIHDAPERMAAYGELIRQLDVPTVLIEIEAMIMDVSSDRVDALGIAWAGRRGNGTIGFGNPSATPAANTLTLASATGAINTTTILANTANYFLAQVNALASVGDAKIRARPSVLTVDNLAAVLDLSQTFYIRTSGVQVSNVTPVTTGTLLKVTPRLIEDGGVRMVQLLVDIEDGRIQETQTVDSLPVVLQTNISTQAVVREEDSLLIGGYSLDSETRTEDKVPILGDIPALGVLFRNREAKHSRSERLFLIRPHVVAYPALGKATDGAVGDLDNGGIAPKMPQAAVPEAAVR